MKTKVTVAHKKANEEGSKYPYYGQHNDGQIVLFLDNQVGIAITGSSCYKIGDKRSFNTTVFPPIIGTITITQE